MALAACGESVFLLTSDLAQTEGPSCLSLSLFPSLPRGLDREPLFLLERKGEHDRERARAYKYEDWG